MMNQATANDRVFMLLSVVVVLAPMPLGSNRPWSWSLLCLLVAVIGLAWTMLVWTGRSRPGLGPTRLWPVLLPFGAALAWGAVQTVPLASPAWGHPIWKDAADALGHPLDATISANPFVSRTALMRLLGYGLIFFLAAQLGRKRQRAESGLRIVALACLAYCSHALAMHYLGVERLLWLPKWAYIGDATGTFVGRGAFGGFAGLGVLACLASLIISMPTRPTRTSDRLERLFSRLIPWMTAVSVAFLAVLASHSRGALFATVAAVLVLLLCVTVAGLIRWRSAALFVFGLVLFGGIAIAVTGEATLARMAGEGDFIGDRPNLYRLTLVAIGDAPWMGHGLGAFEHAFKPYRDPTLPRDVIYDYAHNVWLEVVMDLGWPAGMCLLAAPAIAVGQCAAGLVRRRQDHIYCALAMAAAALFGLQGVVDFTIQMPALAAIFSYLLGIGYSQSWPSR
ncbi:MAG: O-antigen ligase family protein [Alphaproteobacteria bacterium]|nr:O-antigen ligase family protein [Alphaproteobacteria bacterium]